MIISRSRLAQFHREVKNIARSREGIQRGNLVPMVRRLLKKRTAILSLATKHRTPFYCIDTNELRTSIDSFTSTFNTAIPNCKIFYAMKVNHHPFIVKAAIQSGLGIDASSGREALTALRLGAKSILLTGPGKSHDELMLAQKHHKTITLNIDSFSELKKVGTLADKQKKVVRAGIRVHTKECGEWNKFGIPLHDLRTFWSRAKKYPLLNLCGIQVHTSFNNDAMSYQRIIKDIGTYLLKNFSKKMLGSIRFFDFGGGFQPHESEGYYPWNTPLGELVKVIDDNANRKTVFTDPYYITRSATLDEYARGISSAIKKYLTPLITPEYYTEPGHILCNNAMHIVLRVADKKSERAIILDGGINIVGWEKFEYFYFPLINLTRPALTEISAEFFGNLCLPEDRWGFYCYGKSVQEGDVIIVPYQGAATYSFAQKFIKPIPPVYFL